MKERYWTIYYVYILLHSNSFFSIFDCKFSCTNRPKWTAKQRLNQKWQSLKLSLSISKKLNILKLLSSQCKIQKFLRSNRNRSARFAFGNASQTPCFTRSTLNVPAHCATRSRTPSGWNLLRRDATSAHPAGSCWSWWRAFGIVAWRLIVGPNSTCRSSRKQQHHPGV